MNFKKIVSVTGALALATSMTLSTPMVSYAATNDVFGVTANFKNSTGSNDFDYNASSACFAVGIGESVELENDFKVSVDVYIPLPMLADKKSSVAVRVTSDINCGPGFAPSPVGKYEFGNYEIKNNNGKYEALYEATGANTNFPTKKVGDYLMVTVTTDTDSMMYAAFDNGNFVPATYSADPDNHCDQVNVYVLGYNMNKKATVYIDNLKVTSGKNTILDTNFSKMSEYTWLMYAANSDQLVTENVKTIAFNQNLLKLSKTSATVKRGKTVTIKATATPKATITYKSANSKIAKVNSKGVVTGVKAGSTTIKVTANGVTKTYKVKVTK